MNPNATWSSSLKSYHPYLLPQIVSNNSKFIAFIIACPKMQIVVLDALVF
jgi:hypothetical protein